MTWAQRLKRVFSVDIEVCGRCGGSLKVIACIEDQDIIDRILAHLREKEQEAPARPLLVPPTRAPPATLSLFAGSEFQPHISKDATEKTMAWTTAGSRSGMADMNCTINSASNFSGLQAGISQISPAQLAASVRKSTLNRPFISPILYPWGLS